MATTDAEMQGDGGPVDIGNGPEVDHEFVRLADGAPTPNHVPSSPPDMSPNNTSRDVGSENQGRMENVGGNEARMEPIFEHGVLPVGATGTAGVNAIDTLSNNVIDHTTLESLGAGVYDEASLTRELDDFLGGFPSDPSLVSYNSYLDSMFNGVSQPDMETFRPLLNNAPFPSVDHTRWTPDFTYGPPSKHIDVPAFLRDIGKTFGDANRGDFELHLENVAGWEELEKLGADEKRALEDQCSVSDLLKPLVDITSDPAHLAFVREFHNEATLSMLGYTAESIKLPPETRDRKKRIGGKAAISPCDDGTTPRVSEPVQQGQSSGNTRASQAAAGSSTNATRSQLAEQTPSGLKDVVMDRQGNGKIRKGKTRVETENRLSESLPFGSDELLKSISLRSWPLPEVAKHFVRKPRSSDVNVLTKVRPSTIPFLLPEEVADNVPSRPSSPSATGIWEQVAPRLPAQRPHAIIDMSILTPAPHPPHTPRHSMSLALLNSQTLEDIGEALVCASRWIPRSMGTGGGVASGACVVIEGTVYGDGEGDAGDYAEKLVEYLSILKSQNDSASLRKRDKDAIMVLDEQLRVGLPMLHTRLDSVSWKLHKPYWFMHDGGCVHWIIFTSISQLHQCDPPLPTPEKPSNWPYVTSLSPVPHRALCRVCIRVPAVLAVSGDTRLNESPSLVCEGCWVLLGPPRAGRDYPNGGEAPSVLALVSPDGLG